MLRRCAKDPTSSEYEIQRCDKSLHQEGGQRLLGVHGVGLACLNSHRYSSSQVTIRAELSLLMLAKGMIPDRRTKRATGRQVSWRPPGNFKYMKPVPRGFNIICAILF
jgi:hypothetical protein